jgi:hypothetical protein
MSMDVPDMIAAHTMNEFDTDGLGKVVLASPVEYVLWYALRSEKEEHFTRELREGFIRLLDW